MVSLRSCPPGGVPRRSGGFTWKTSLWVVVARDLKQLTEHVVAEEQHHDPRSRHGAPALARAPRGKCQERASQCQHREEVAWLGVAERQRREGIERGGC